MIKVLNQKLDTSIIFPFGGVYPFFIYIILGFVMYMYWPLDPTLSFPGLQSLIIFVYETRTNTQRSGLSTYWKRKHWSHSGSQAVVTARCCVGRSDLPCDDSVCCLKAELSHAPPPRPPCGPATGCLPGNRGQGAFLNACVTGRIDQRLMCG